MARIDAMLCRRARLVPNQALRGFAPDADFAIVAALHLRRWLTSIRNLWAGALVASLHRSIYKRGNPGQDRNAVTCAARTTTIEDAIAGTA
jgi:hypothetical protein